MSSHITFARYGTAVFGTDRYNSQSVAITLTGVFIKWSIFFSGLTSICDEGIKQMKLKFREKYYWLPLFQIFI